MALNKEQIIYINLDDSGKLTRKEKVSVYGGIVFLSKEERDKFIVQYRKIINEIKCKYCNKDKENCSNNCPEIKNTNIKKTDKRRIMNYIKKYYVISLIVENNKVYDYIIKNKASKGRYIDFTLRVLIKKAIEELIKIGKIDPNKPLKIILNIDEQSTKSNGYYNLKDSIYEELVHGIYNYNYDKSFKPILNNGLDLNISYQDSGKSYAVQGADLIAGTIRRKAINNSENKKSLAKELSFVDFKIFFPWDKLIK